jgi:hypothetical protein
VRLGLHVRSCTPAERAPTKTVAIELPRRFSTSAVTVAPAVRRYVVFASSPRPSPFGVTTPGATLSCCTASGAGAAPIEPDAARICGAVIAQV